MKYKRLKNKEMNSLKNLLIKVDFREVHLDDLLDKDPNLKNALKKVGVLQ